MVRKLNITILDLIIPSDKIYLKSFIFEPKPLKEKEPQKLVGVFGIEIEDKKKASDIVEKIISCLKEKYYQRVSFEDALNAINETLASLVQEGEIQWIGKLHSVLLYIDGKTITLTCSGEAKVLLLRGRELIDISEGVAEPSSSSLKTFTNIVSGNLEHQDKLILSTSPLSKFISAETSKKIFLNFPLDQAILKFKNRLGKACLGLVFIEAKKMKEFKEIERPSIKYPPLDLEITEPGARILAKKTLHQLKGISSKFIKNSAWQASEIFKKARGIIEKGKPSLPRLKPISFFNIKWEEFKKFFKDIPQNFRKLPLSARIFFIAALILFLLFCGSLVLISSRKKETAKITQLEEWLAQAKNKERQASDALIYKDKEKAKGLLFEAKDLVDKILKEKKVPKKHKQDAEKLLSKIKEQFDIVEHTIRIADPIELANFQNVEPALDLKEIEGVKNRVYSFNPVTNTILSLDEDNRRLITLPVESRDIGHLILASAVPEKNKIIFYTEGPAIAEFNIKENKLTKIETEFLPHENIKDLASYLDKIYLLDVASSQIYKHSRTISGYSKGKTWLNKEINLENAVSLAIDGNIWVLTSDGTVLKFFAGDLQEFSLDPLVQPLDQPTKIKTSLDLKNLYIADPKNKRVVVFDKQGNLVSQYISDLFEDLKDIYVNEKEGKMYLLCGKKIFKIELKKE